MLKFNLVKGASTGSGGEITEPAGTGNEAQEGEEGREPRAGAAGRAGD